MNEEGKWWVNDPCVCPGCGHTTMLQRWAEKDESVSQPYCGHCGEHMKWDTSTRKAMGGWGWITGELVVTEEREL